MCPSNEAFGSIPYVYTDIIKGQPAVVVAYGDDMSIYRKLLTIRGCQEVGRWLASRGFKRWVYSSGMDFPKDVRPAIKFDPKYYIENPEED